MAWQSPSIQLRWGPWFPPDPEDQQKVVALVQEALGKGDSGTPLITLRQAVEHIATIFEIENIDAALEALEKEREEKAEKQQTEFERQQEALHAVVEGVSGGKRPGRDRGAGEGKPPKASGGGSGGAAYPPKET